MNIILYIWLLSTSLFSANEERFTLIKKEDEIVIPEVKIDKQYQLLEQINERLLLIYNKLEEIGIVVEDYRPEIYSQCDEVNLEEKEPFVVEDPGRFLQFNQEDLGLSG